MKKKEFIEKLKTEKLTYRGLDVVVDYGISSNDFRYVFSCTQYGNRYYIFIKEQVGYGDRGEEPLQKYIDVYDRKGRVKKYPLNYGITVLQSFESEEEAFDKFYEMIKTDMDKKN